MSTSVNVGWNRNKITALTGNAETDAISARDVPVGVGGHLQWHMVGQPAFTYLVYQQVYDNDGNPVPDLFVDQNADGVINDDDLIKFHSPEPKVTLSWNNNFNYKNWDLSFALRANLGNYVVENASFLRCDNITLGYTWPDLLNDNLRLRLYGAVQNPFVITKYKGLDPEVFDGIDNNVYPRPVSFTVGLIATF